jgi:hypothetical protein
VYLKVNTNTEYRIMLSNRQSVVPNTGNVGENNTNDISTVQNTHGTISMNSTHTPNASHTNTPHYVLNVSNANDNSNSINYGNNEHDVADVNMHNNTHTMSITPHDSHVNNGSDIARTSDHNMINAESDMRSDKSYTVNANTKQYVIVETDSGMQKFNLYDNNRNLIGGFSSVQLIKYVIANDTKCNSTSFLSNEDYLSSQPVIEKYIGVYSKEDNEIVLRDYIESPFMGSVETLVKLYMFINDFEKHRLSQQLNYVSDEKDRECITDALNRLIYNLLTHTMKVITAITNRIDNMPHKDRKESDKSVKESLLRYGVSIMYRLSKFVKSTVEKSYNKINRDVQELRALTKNRDEIVNRLDASMRIVEAQNQRINALMTATTNSINVNSMSGGGMHYDSYSDYDMLHDDRDIAYDNDEYNDHNEEHNEYNDYIEEGDECGVMEGDGISEFQPNSSITNNMRELIGGSMNTDSSHNTSSNATSNVSSNTTSNKSSNKTSHNTSENNSYSDSDNDMDISNNIVSTSIPIGHSMIGGSANSIQSITGADSISTTSSNLPQISTLSIPDLEGDNLTLYDLLV